jgi:hypothetical protein
MLFQDIMKSEAAEIKDKYTLETSMPTVDDYLTETEKLLIKNASKKANNISASTSTSSDFMSLSLTQILSNWSNAMQNIMLDISRNISINQYIRESDNAYEFIVQFITKLWQIMSVDDRLIYLGMTLIFIATVVYFVNITN